MKIKMPKFNFGKAAAYGAGAMVGGGLTWLGWRWLEGRGIDPLSCFKKKVEDGHRIYYDPSKDPNVNMDEIEVPEIDAEDEEDDEEDDPDEPPARTVKVISKANAPYQIDGETWFHSEEDEGFAHGRLTYYQDDQQILDENNELVLEPWKKIGIENYDALRGEFGADEMFVRDEFNNIDYVITIEEGASDDNQG